MPGHKRPRPSTGGDDGDRLKLHRRPLRADGRDYSVITLRPGMRARFSTNRFHETWHILSDRHGALLLSRLLWGLSFQRLPGTVVVIDRPHLDPNPFDAEPADPIVLVPAHLTTLTPQAIRRLRRRTAEPSHGTVRWHTWGLDAEVARVRECQELRLFRDYHRKVSAARTARREVLAGLSPAAHPDDVNRLVWRQADAVRARRGQAVRV